MRKIIALILAAAVIACTAMVAFAADVTVTVTSPGDKGTITVSDGANSSTSSLTVAVGTKITITAAAGAGYRLVNIRCNNSIVGAGPTAEYIVTDKTTVSATLAKENCAISIVQPENGTIEVTDGKDPVGNSITFGTQLTITTTPDSTSKLVSIKANGKVIGKTSPLLYTPIDDVTITAVFSDASVPSGDGDVTVNASAVCDSFYSGPSGGKILVLNSAGNPVANGGKVAKGETLTVRAEAYSNYTFNGITCTSSPKGEVTDLLANDSFLVGDNATSVSFVAHFTYNKQSSSQPDDDTKTDAAKPYVIISSYAYGGTNLTAGDTASLTLTFYNTSKTLSVENMKVTMAMPEALMLTSSSNSFYVESLASGKSITKTVQITAKPTAAPASHEITVSFDYDYVDNSVRKSGTTSESISIPVVQVDRFEVTGTEMPDQVVVGEEGYLSVNFVNKGRSEVYNISAEISGNIQNPGQQQNLGNLASGTSSSADFSVMPTESGVCAGEVKITYEDTNMQEKTVTIPYSFTAMSHEEMYGPTDPVINPGIDPGMEEPAKKGLPVWAYIAGGVVIAGAGGLIAWKKIKNKRSEAEDADI